MKRVPSPSCQDAADLSDSVLAAKGGAFTIRTIPAEPSIFVGAMYTFCAMGK